MCDLDAAGPQAFYQRVRRARKEHCCCACGETIRPGDRYSVSSGIWDGEPDSFKHCLRCRTMINMLMEYLHEPIDLELSCGETWESVFDRPPPPRVAELAFLSRDEGQAL